MRAGGQTIAFWWLVFVLFTTGGVIWFMSVVRPPHARWIDMTFKLIHIGAGIGLTVDLAVDLWREGIKTKLRETLRLETLKELLRLKKEEGGK